MPEIRATWQLSAWIAVGLASLVIAGRVVRRRSDERRLYGRLARRLDGFGTEFTMVVGLFAVYQYCGHFAHVWAAGAVRHARGVVAVERRVHLPSEVALQRLLLPHPLAVRAANAYYESLHLVSLATFVVWIWWRHGEHYRRARNIVAASTLACLLVQLIPVAPPRLMPDLGFVDTALKYGQSVYGPDGTGIADQLAAMPSIHVLWATIIASFVWRVSPSRWRWVVVVHLPLTMIVVVATANHWWLDGLVAIGILGLTLPLVGTADRLHRAAVIQLRRRPARRAEESESDAA